MADLEAKALDKETLDEIKSELEETKKIIKGIGIHGPFQEPFNKTVL